MIDVYRENETMNIEDFKDAGIEKFKTSIEEYKN